MRAFSRDMAAFYDFDCDNCGSMIFEGDTFFFSEGERWCEDCHDQEVA